MKPIAPRDQVRRPINIGDLVAFAQRKYPIFTLMYGKVVNIKLNKTGIPYLEIEIGGKSGKAFGENMEIDYRQAIVITQQVESNKKDFPEQFL